MEILNISYRGAVIEQVDQFNYLEIIKKTT